MLRVLEHRGSPDTFQGINTLFKPSGSSVYVLFIECSSVCNVGGQGDTDLVMVITLNTHCIVQVEKGDKNETMQNGCFIPSEEARRHTTHGGSIK